MIRLLPHTEYEVIYRDGSLIRFRTIDDVPEAKHQIRVQIVATRREENLVALLERPWVDIKEVRADTR